MSATTSRPPASTPPAANREPVLALPAKIGPQATKVERRQAVAHAMEEVAELLSNKPAVARASYVDPRVVEAYEAAEVAGSEEKVMKLLGTARDAVSRRR
jgi:hypothetical protein